MMPKKLEVTSPADLAEHGFSRRSYRLGIEVHCSDESLLTLLSARMPPGSTVDPESNVDAVFSVIVRAQPGDDPPQFELYKANRLLARDSERDQLLDHFESAIGIFVAENAQDYVFVHAGCVSWNGKAIVIPGLSFSGKTSLVAALIRAGAVYYSDEYCVLDENGLVHPYPRRLSVRGEHGRIRMTAEDCGSVAGTEAIPAGRIIYTKFEADAQWQPLAITPGESVMLLLKNTVCAQNKPAQTLPILVKLAESASGLKGARGDVNQCAAQILSID